MLLRLKQPKFVAPFVALLSSPLSSPPLLQLSDRGRSTEYNNSTDYAKGGRDRGTEGGREGGREGMLGMLL